MSGLEHLDRIAIRIFDLDLLSAWSYLDLISESQPRVLEDRDGSREIFYLQYYTVPSAGLLLASIGHRSRAGRSRAAENQFQISDRDLGECRQVLLIEVEAQMLCIEIDSPAHIPDLIPYTPEPKHQ